MCKISILMSVYNGEAYIADAIESVLNQSFEDFEFIIINDGSTDDTLSIINSYDDTRIRLFNRENNYIQSLNWGLSIANGKYIARMDADDVMVIDRLKIQYNIMEKNSDIVICASSVQLIDHTRFHELVPITQFGLISDSLIYLLKGNFIYHPTVMLRLDFIRLNNIQYGAYPYAEDYKLWFDLLRLGGKLYIESLPLLYYRLSETRASNLYKKEQEIANELIKNEILFFLIQQCYPVEDTLTTLSKALSKIETLLLMDSSERLNFWYSFFMKNRKLLNQRVV